jgi:hypothetical protein
MSVVILDWTSFAMLIDISVRIMRIVQLYPQIYFCPKSMIHIAYCAIDCPTNGVCT